MTPKQRTRVAWLVVNDYGIAFNSFETRAEARDSLWPGYGGSVVRVTYPWPVRTRAKGK
jgi:hypothetical protein